MLRTKCMYADAEPEDGLRVSVMSRHTENDGVTPDPAITSDKYDHHWRLYAPVPKLIGVYLRGEIGWKQFCTAYEAYLRMGEMPKYVSTLAYWARDRNITLLCKEATPEYCHRRLLAEECKRLVPILQVHIA